MLFDLQATVPQDISIVFVSDTKGTIVPKLISGALTRVPAGVNHRIDWEVLKEVGAFEGDLYPELSFDMRRIREEARIEQARIEQARIEQARKEEQARKVQALKEEVARIEQVRKQARKDQKSKIINLLKGYGLLGVLYLLIYLNAKRV